jgi:hypothetical protein
LRAAGEGAAAEQGVAGVHAEVEEDRVDLGGAGGDGPEVGGDAGVEADVFGQGLASDHAEVAEEVCDMDLAGFAAAALGEAKDLADEAGAALGVFLEHRAELEIAGGGDVLGEHRHAHEPRREDGGEVGGDAGGEPADAGEALGAAEVVHEVPVFGEVGGDGEAGFAFAQGVCSGAAAAAFGAFARGALDGGDAAFERVLEEVIGGAFLDGRDGAFVVRCGSPGVFFNRFPSWCAGNPRRARRRARPTWRRCCSPRRGCVPRCARRRARRGRRRRTRHSVRTSG